MKKLLYIFLTTSIIFFACKKENPTTGSSGGTSIFGCTDSLALNYNPNATVDDGSCIYITDPSTGSILGKWNLTQYEQHGFEGYYTNYPNGKVTTWDTTAILTLPDPIDSIESITWEFFSDQTMEETMVEYGYPDSTDTDYYTWWSNGDILVLDTHWVLTINTLTSNNLSWTNDRGEDTSSYYQYYDANTGYWQSGYGDTIHFSRRKNRLCIFE